MTGMCVELGAPKWPQVMSATIMLLFATPVGQRLERNFRANFTHPVDAHNVACCIWGHKRHRLRSDGRRAHRRGRRPATPGHAGGEHVRPVPCRGYGTCGEDRPYTLVDAAQGRMGI